MTVQIEEVQFSVPSNDSIIPMTFQSRSEHGTFLLQHTGLGNARPRHRLFGSDTQDGAFYGGTVIPERIISFRIGLEAIDRNALAELRANFFRMFSSNHELLIRVSRNDGTVRALKGYVQEGTAYDSGTRIGRVEQHVVAIVCPNPICNGDMREADISGSVQAGSTFRIPSTIPSQIGAGDWSASHPTHYEGNYKSYICIDIHGPATTFTLRNETTGGSLVLAKGVGVGVIVSVDANTLSVHDATGADQYGTVNFVSSNLAKLYLQHGNNTLSIEGTGFDGSSRAVVTWTERWLNVV